jgi:hypothetical protein
VAGIKTAINTYIVSRLSSFLLGWGWTQEVNLLSNLGHYTYYILGPHRSLNKLPAPGLITKAEAETEYIIEGEIIIEVAIIREENFPAREAPTPLESNGEYSNKECRLDELVSINMFVIDDETISNAKVFANAISYQSLNNELF